MADKPKIDYGNVTITKLPDGEAYGARDLTNWSLRRSTGAGGLQWDKAKSVVLVCRACGKKRDVLKSAYTKAKSVKDRCDCGGRMDVKMFKPEGIPREGDKIINVEKQRRRRAKP